jgi:hypothetical protein
MPHQEPITDETAEEATIDSQRMPAREEPAYEPIEGDDDWLAEPEELPPRPRRRLLSPVPIALLAVLLTACGFIGGVLVEKGEGSSSSSSGSASSLASRFRAARGGTSSTGAAFASGSPGAGSAITRPTAGTVAYLAGSTLYVTNSEGNTVKVTTSAGTSVSKTVKATIKGIHPGETVTVAGETGSNGVISAESISVGSSGSGLAALFAGSGGSAAKGASGGRSGGGEPSLFGGG